MKDTPREPTTDECSANAEIAPGYFAIWYPQMGGYGSKAVVCVGTSSQEEDACFDAYIWHDGEFPFSSVDQDGGKNVALIHHCAPSQFIAFGNRILELEKRKQQQ